MTILKHFSESQLSAEHPITNLEEEREEDTPAVDHYVKMVGNDHYQEPRSIHQRSATSISEDSGVNRAHYNSRPRHQSDSQAMARSKSQSFKYLSRT